MKTIGFVNEKGGVGKTFLATQFALFCALQFKFKTVFIDLDAQGNASDFLKRAENFKVFDVASSSLFQENCELNLKNAFDESNLVLIPAPEDRSLTKIIDSTSEGLLKKFNNFFNSVKQLDEQCDLVVFDSSPNADIRSNCAIAFSDVVVCPLHLTNDSFKGVHRTKQRVMALNDAAELFFAINMVRKSDLQAYLKDEIVKLCADHLLVVKQSDITISKGNNIAITDNMQISAIQEHNCYAIAHHMGAPIWAIDSAGWKELRGIFYTLLEALDVERDFVLTDEFKAALEHLKLAYPDNWKAILRQYWLSNSKLFNTLPNVSKSDRHKLWLLREHASLSLVKPD